MIKQKNLTLLLIDDEEEVVDLLKKFLERHGYTIYTASNGVEGLEVIHNHSISVVFCDIKMPEMDGITFLSHLQNENIKPEVIMITGNPSRDNCLKSVRYDACQYLVKPISREEILNSLKKAKERINEKAPINQEAFQQNRNVKSPAPEIK